MVHEKLRLPHGLPADLPLHTARLGALSMLIALTGCSEIPAQPDIGAPSPTPSISATESSAGLPPRSAEPRSNEATVAAALWAVTRVVDGDTIDVSNATATETVRLLGIDTPESGECGFDSASAHLSLVTNVDSVTLTAAGDGKDDRDRYGRILRYVEVDGVDVGLTQIEQGYAIARYDSRDGYGAHPREEAYVAADESTPQEGCSAAGESGAPALALASEPADASAVPFTSCAAARAAGAAPVQRGQPGYGSHLDRDHDGWGCE
jgi:endonuclease YncB( thermonuclease family)